MRHAQSRILKNHDAALESICCLVLPSSEFIQSCVEQSFRLSECAARTIICISYLILILGMMNVST